MADSLTPQPPPLTLLATLPSPSGHGVRTWQSKAHPSHNKPLLATASSDKSVSIFSLRDFRLLSTITGGHKRSVRCVEWKDYSDVTADSTDTNEKGQQQQQEEEDNDVILATGSFDANVGIWVHNDRYDSANSGGPIGVVKGVNGAGGAGNDGDEDVEIDVSARENNEDEDEEWHFSTLLTGPDSEIKSIAFSPAHYSANFLATSSRDKSVWVWEEVEQEEWETIAVLGDHTGDVKCVSWCRGAVVDDGGGGGGGGAGERRIVGSRQVLASGSYDDTIRLWKDVEEEGDWVCVAYIDGHKGTVWDICWEGHLNRSVVPADEVDDWEPRLLSCSDDLTVRLWRRELTPAEKERKRNKVESSNSGGSRLPNIIRPRTAAEQWFEEAKLPEVHLRSVYAVDWSRRTGLILSCGGDGTIAVYKEVLVDQAPESFTDSNAMQVDRAGDADTVMNGTTEPDTASTPTTKWVVVALMEAAHDEYELNHVCWALRRDKDRRNDEEEIIVSTADDGAVKIWTLPDSIVV